MFQRKTISLMSASIQLILFKRYSHDKLEVETDDHGMVSIKPV